jgi:drug/metabolite transporter (DMT)-like permease
VTANDGPPSEGGRTAAGERSAAAACGGAAAAGRAVAGPMDGRSATRRPMLTAILGAASISSSGILVTLAGAGPITTAFFRCALALPVLALLAILEQRRLGPRPLATRLSAMTAGVFLAVDLVLWNHAIADVGAGVATVLGNLQVLFVAVFAWLVLRERPGRQYLVMLPVVMVGVVLVAGMVGGHASGVSPLAGIGFGVGTSAAYACFLLILRSSSGQTPHVAGQLADATVGATAGAALIGLLLGGFQLDIGWRSFGWLLLLALLSQTVGWLLITSSLPKLPAAISSLLLLLQPAAAMVLADIVLGERPTLFQDAGALLVCLGVLAAARTVNGEKDVAIGKARRRRMPPQPGGSNIRRELDPQDRGQLCPVGESEL